eukprot:SAG22_NODE_1054_length_5793_cov_316.779593_3_plen_574_part_01
MALGVDHMWVNADGDLKMRAGNELDLVVNNDGGISIGGALSAFAGGGVDLLTTSFSASVDTLDVHGETANFGGAKEVQLATTGAAVGLKHLGDTKFVSFNFKLVSTFNEFENYLPTVHGVNQVLVVSTGRSPPLARPLTKAAISLQRAAAGSSSPAAAGGGGGGSWTEIWSAVPTSEPLDMANFVMEVQSMDVAGAFREHRSVVTPARPAFRLFLVLLLPLPLFSSTAPFVAVVRHPPGIRLASNPWLSPSFVGWDDVIFQFRTQSFGQVQIDADATIDLVAGDALNMVSDDMAISALESLAVYGGQTIDATARAISVTAADSIGVVSETVDVHATGKVAVHSTDDVVVSSDRLAAQVQMAADLTVGRNLDVSAFSAGISVADELELAAERLKIHTSKTAEVFVETNVALTAADLGLSLGNRLEVVARAMEAYTGDLSLVAERADVNILEGVSLSTQVRVKARTAISSFADPPSPSPLHAAAKEERGSRSKLTPSRPARSRLDQPRTSTSWPAATSGFRPCRLSTSASRPRRSRPTARCSPPPTTPPCCSGTRRCSRPAAPSPSRPAPPSTLSR